MPHADYERLRDGGRVREAVEALLELPEFRAILVQHVRHLAELCPEPGAWCAPLVAGRVRELHADSDEPLTPNVERLLVGPDTFDPGVVSFPVAFANADGADGDLLRFIVAHGLPNHEVQDDGFTQAVEDARCLAKHRFGEEALEGLQWQVHPRGLARSCTGGSVGLAAYLAFASRATGVRLPVNVVFTGVLGRDSWVAPRMETLRPKLAAVKRCGYRTRLCSPRPAMLREGLDVDWLPVEANGHCTFDAVDLRFQIERSLSAPTDEVGLRLLALVDAAAGAPVGVELLHAALECWSAGIATTAGVCVEDRLAALECTGWLTRPDDGSPRDDAPTYVLRAKPPTRERIEKARTALGEAHAATPKGSDPVATLRRLSDWARVDARAAGEGAAGSQLELGELLLDAPGRPGAPASAHDRLKVGLAPLRSLRDRVDSNASSYDALLDGLARAKADGPLIALALRAESAPSPIARLAGKLAEVRTGVDRLLWVQVVCEAALHLACLPALVSLPHGKQAAELRQRPSLGKFVEVVGALDRQGGAPSGLHKELQLNFENTGHFTQRWNDVLHHTGAWLELSALAPSEGAAPREGASDHANAGDEAKRLARDGLAILRCFTADEIELWVVGAQGHRVAARGTRHIAPEAFGPRPGYELTVRGRTFDVSGWVVQASATDASAVAFHRGRNDADGRERWFGFEPAKVLFAASTCDSPVEVAPYALAGQEVRSPVAVAERNVAVDRLPLPVARIAKHLGPKPETALACLGAADLAFASLLRLLVFPARVPAALKKEHELAFKRPIKRRLVNLAIQLAAVNESTFEGRLLAPFRHEDYRRRSHDLVHLLEWLEHCGGPLHHHDRAIEQARNLSRWLVEGSDADGERWPWSSAPSMPLAAVTFLPASLAGETLEVVARGAQAVSFYLATRDSRYSGMIEVKRTPSEGEPCDELFWTDGVEILPLPRAGVTVDRAENKPTIWIRRDIDAEYTVDVLGRIRHRPAKLCPPG